MQCQIVGVVQDMDFEENIAQMFLVLALPSGERIRTAISDIDAEKVVKLHVGARGVPRVAVRATAETAAAPPAPQADAEAPEEEEVSTTEAPDGTVVHVFGGQDDSEAEAVEDYTEPPAAAAEAPPPPDPQKRRGRARNNGPVPRGPNVQTLPNGRVIVPSRTVPKNEAGYPQVAGNGVDPDELTGTRNQDEDGVGSI